MIVPPGLQFVDPVDLVVSNPVKNIDEPRLRINTIERNWKINFKEQDSVFGETRSYSTPRIYNLLADPLEKENVLFPHTWVPKAALGQLAAHLVSLKANPPISVFPVTIGAPSGASRHIGSRQGVCLEAAGGVASTYPRSTWRILAY